MKRIATLTAAALLAAPAAFADQHMVEDEAMSMMEQRLQDALADCGFPSDEYDVMELTLAEVSGIIMESNSEDDNQDKCQTIEGFLGD